MRSLFRRKLNIGTILSQEIHEGNPSTELGGFVLAKNPSFLFFPFVLHDKSAQSFGIIVQTEISQKLQPWIPTGLQLQTFVSAPHARFRG